MKMGTPQIGDPGSPFSLEYGDLCPSNVCKDLRHSRHCSESEEAAASSASMLAMPMLCSFLSL